METRRTSSTVYIVKQLSKETTQLRHNNEGLSYRSLHTGDTFHFKLQDLLFLFYFTVGEFLSVSRQTFLSQMRLQTQTMTMSLCCKEAHRFQHYMDSCILGLAHF